MENQLENNLKATKQEQASKVIILRISNLVAYGI